MFIIYMSGSQYMDLNLFLLHRIITMHAKWEYFIVNIWHISFASLIANSESMVAKESLRGHVYHRAYFLYNFYWFMVYWQVFYLQKAVLSTFTVSRIEEEDDFWFHSCTACHAEVLRIERKFKCETCNRMQLSICR